MVKSTVNRREVFSLSFLVGVLQGVFIDERAVIAVISLLWICLCYLGHQLKAANDAKTILDLTHLPTSVFTSELTEMPIDNAKIGYNISILMTTLVGTVIGLLVGLIAIDGLS